MSHLAITDARLETDGILTPEGAFPDRIWFTPGDNSSAAYIRLDLHEAAIASSPERWQPIETAPKDGTKIDLWADGRMTDCFWRDGDWLRYSHSIRCVPRYVRYLELNPTHWMAKPPPPETRGVSQEAVLTITVRRDSTSLHTVAAKGLQPSFILQAALDALHHEYDSLAGCPFHTRSEERPVGHRPNNDVTT